MKYFKRYQEFVNESGFHNQTELTEREYSDEERTKLADKGFALPDGSYPIKDVEDLKNAIHAYGRAKDQAAAAKHIVKRAKALGAEDLIPTSEDFQKSLKEEVNESLNSSDKKKFEDFFKHAIGKRATVTADDYSEEGKLEMSNGMYKVDDGDMLIDVDYLVSTDDMKIISMSSKKLVYKHGDTWTIEIK
jgi:preprotein translocase subunit SecD